MRAIEQIKQRLQLIEAIDSEVSSRDFDKVHAVRPGEFYSKLAQLMKVAQSNYFRADVKKILLERHNIVRMESNGAYYFKRIR